MSTPKRVQKDIINYKKSDLDKNGIYCIFNDDNIMNVKVMIIGPKDTPYQYGFYLFDLEFPKQYPFVPPTVNFVTYGKQIRFNPNLYINGKVCLSILGTWSGPGWTSCCSLNTVLLSIQTLLNETPIQNEPGWENCNDHRSTDYNKVIEYGNVCVATIDTYSKLPYGYEGFKDIMKEKIIENKDYYLSYLDNKEEENLTSRIYSMKVETEYKFYKNKLNTILNELNVPIKGKKTYVRKCPNDPAKKYEIGVVMDGNDGCSYIVREKPNGGKKWYKLE